MGVGPPESPCGGCSKPPTAALVEACRGERCGNFELQNQPRSHPDQGNRERRRLGIRRQRSSAKAENPVPPRHLRVSGTFDHNSGRHLRQVSSARIRALTPGHHGQVSQRPPPGIRICDAWSCDRAASVTITTPPTRNPYPTTISHRYSSTDSRSRNAEVQVGYQTSGKRSSTFMPSASRKYPTKVTPSPSASKCVTRTPSGS